MCMYGMVTPAKKKTVHGWMCVSPSVPSTNAFLTCTNKNLSKKHNTPQLNKTA